jgi:hypothetical protein
MHLRKRQIKNPSVLGTGWNLKHSVKSVKGQGQTDHFTGSTFLAVMTLTCLRDIPGSNPCLVISYSYNLLGFYQYF